MILTIIRDITVRTAVIVAKTPSNAAVTPAKRAAITAPIALISVTISPMVSQFHFDCELPKIAGTTTTTIARSNAAASVKTNAIYLSVSSA